MAGAASVHRSQRLALASVGHPPTVTIVGGLIAFVVLAVILSYALRNTSGARGTNEPGAMAGNLALVFVVVVIAGVAVLALIGASQ